MDNSFRQLKSEIRQLPWMLGKLLGGVMAVIGFTTAVIVGTRRADPTLADLLPPVVLGAFGILLFVLSSRMLARRIAERIAEKPTPGEQARTSLLAWAILGLLAAVFLAVVFLLR
jgi:hypothetical protein